MAESLVAVIMAGGAGERLRPLTDVRAKPAVPFGAIYRIIDFTLSNCLNSDIRQIMVLTQYKSHSLSRHLHTGFGFLPRRLDQFIEEIPAQMQLGTSWYKGTADAIRQNLGFIERASPERVIILSGDHIYKMDYRQMLAFHEERRAAVTVAVLRVPVELARGAYGVLESDAEDRILGFEEKPAAPKAIPGTTDCLASMGIYIFDWAQLRRSLASDHLDFGKEIIPSMVANREAVFAYDFSTRNRIADYVYTIRDGQRVKELVPSTTDSTYWRDVGTLDSYWLANLDLVAVQPTFSLYGERWPLFSCPELFPPAKFVHDVPGRHGCALNSIVAEGVILSGATVRSSVLGPGLYIHSYAEVDNSVLMGGSIRRAGISETSIGRGCRIRNAIIDKNAMIREGTIIGYDRHEDERRGLKTQTIAGTDDWVVVVPKEALI